MTDSFDSKQFRSALGSFATGVTIVTTATASRDVGLTANSFNSVSLDPPMVLWSLAKSSGSLETFNQASHFAVHVLAADQEELSNRFAGKNADKFAGVEVARGSAGVPLFAGCAAIFQCRTAYRYEGGDHVIFVGEVIGFEHADKPPLLYHGGRYALARTKPAEVPRLDGEMAGTSLGNLITRTFMQLVAPMRRSAEKLGFSPSERYMMNVLLAGGAHDLAAVNAIIAHTGTVLTIDVAEGLLGRGLIERENAAGGEPRYRLTLKGREPMIELLAAAKAHEADALAGLSEEEQGLLGRLLTQVSTRLAARGDEQVTRHLDLIRVGAQRIGQASSKPE